MRMKLKLWIKSELTRQYKMEKKDGQMNTR